MSDGQRAMTLRIPELLAEDLALVARLDETSATAICQSAIAIYLSRRIGETDFQAKLQADIDHSSRRVRPDTTDG